MGRPGAILIPVDELRDRLGEVGDDVIVHCAVGIRGHTAARILAAAGKRARNLDGGYRTWSSAHTVGGTLRVPIPQGA
jgi:rhodanese-related sulfurtransferase